MLPYSGSSPRLRGTRPCRRLRQGLGPVHPRACGERCQLSARLRSENGSSPRLRGTLGAGKPNLSKGRFIPAPAGNADQISSSKSVCTVHPRACGERRTAGGCRSMNAGSSPRLRGTHGLGLSRVGTSRFIPAPAGNARMAWRRLTATPVHPRACGERDRNVVH